MPNVGALYPVVVDDREQTPPPEARVAELKGLGVPAAVGHLGVGDYQWSVDYGEEGGLWFVVVERKSISDFLSSMRDGRINHFLDLSGGQTPSECTMRFLLLEGNQFQYGDYGYNPVEPESLDNALVSLQRWGVAIVRSPHAGATAERLKSLREYTARHEHTTFLKVMAPAPTAVYLNPQTKEKVRALMGLPGWGEARARAAVAELGSVGAVLDSVRARDYNAFKSVKGVGKGLVDNAAAFLWG